MVQGPFHGEYIHSPDVVVTVADMASRVILREDVGFHIGTVGGALHSRTVTRSQNENHGWAFRASS